MTQEELSIISHDELIELNGRYRTMFDLQASHFESYEEGVAFDVLE